MAMQEFRISEAGFKKLKRRMLLLTIIPVIIIVTTFSLTNMLDSKHDTGNSWLYALPIFAIWFGISTYRSMKKQKKFLETYKVTISDKESDMNHADHNSGVFPVKYPIYPSDDPNKISSAYAEIRLAEIYYSLAECKYRAGDKAAAGRSYGDLSHRPERFERKHTAKTESWILIQKGPGSTLEPFSNPFSYARSNTIISPL